MSRGSGYADALDSLPASSRRCCRSTTNTRNACWRRIRPRFWIPCIPDWPLRENAPALETLLESAEKAGDSTHVTELYELLAHACVQSGESGEGRDYYLKLTQLEPENQLHARNYQQVLGKLGTTSGLRLITAEEGAVLVDELEATAPFIDQRYADDVALTVRAALTDAELFISYNMPAKALGPLLSALPQAPRDLRMNQRLAALHTRAGRFTEAAVCCRTLEGIYHEAGHPDDAIRYGELAAKYEERAAAMPVSGHEMGVEPAAPKIAAPEFPVAVAPAEAPVTDHAPAVAASAAAAASAASGLFFHAPPTAPTSTPQEHAEFEVHAEPAEAKEIDLSEEWEGALPEEPRNFCRRAGRARLRQPRRKLQPAPRRSQKP